MKIRLVITLSALLLGGCVGGTSFTGTAAPVSSGGAISPPPTIPSRSPQASSNAALVSPTDPSAPAAVSVLFTRPQNGWFPSLSDDGRYVAYGQGQQFIRDLANPGNEISLNSVGAQLYRVGFIRPGFYSFIQDTSNTTAVRYEYDTSTGRIGKTSDDPALVVGNHQSASGGHWMSSRYAGRLVLDNRVVIPSGVGDAQMDGDFVAYCDPSNSVLSLMRNNSTFATYTPRIPMYSWVVQESGYVLYGGYGRVHGIDPSGKDTDLTVTPWAYEGPAKLLMVNGQMWVATTSFDSADGIGMVLLRPYGDSSAIYIRLNSVSADVAVSGSDFVVASNDDKGNLTVLTVPIHAPRVVFTAAAPAPSLSAPNHAIDLGYYYQDGRYGDFDPAVFPYTNLALECPEFYDSAASWNNSNPALDIGTLFAASLKEAYDAGKTIFILPGAEANWDRMLDVAAPYWSKVKYVQMFAENATIDAATAEATTNRFLAKLASHGLRKPLITALESPGAWAASNTDVAEIEAYIPVAEQNDANVFQDGQSLIEAKKAQIPSGKRIMITMMGYDRNGQWTNQASLEQAQYPAYTEAYKDSRVIGITIFSYARAGGTKDHPELAAIHQQISEKIRELSGGVFPPFVPADPDPSPSPGDSCGAMQANTASSCGNDVFAQSRQSGTDACSAWCATQNADACELKGGNCYAERGSGCSDYQSPHTVNWYAAVCSSSRAGGSKGSSGGAASGDTLGGNRSLKTNQSLTSQNGLYMLIYQGDGNLVIYKSGGIPIWSSKTSGSNPGEAVVQGSDGNFVIYDSAGKPVWAADTAGNPGDHLLMQNDGNLVIYDVSGKAVWASNSVQAE